MSQQTAVYFDAEGNEISIQDIVAEHSGGLVKDLRDKLKDSQKEAKLVPDLKDALAKYERGDAIKGAGLDTLNDKQRKALEASHDGEWTADALRATAVELGFAQKSEEEQQLEEDLEAQTRITTAATGGAPGNSGVITPTDVAGWPVDKTVRFKQKFPQEFELLKQGNEVAGITFQ